MGNQESTAFATVSDIIAASGTAACGALSDVSPNNGQKEKHCHGDEVRRSSRIAGRGSADSPLNLCTAVVGEARVVCEGGDVSTVDNLKSRRNNGRNQRKIGNYQNDRDGVDQQQQQKQQYAQHHQQYQHFDQQSSGSGSASGVGVGSGNTAGGGPGGWSDALRDLTFMGRPSVGTGGGGVVESETNTSTPEKTSASGVGIGGVHSKTTNNGHGGHVNSATSSSQSPRHSSVRPPNMMSENRAQVASSRREGTDGLHTVTIGLCLSRRHNGVGHPDTVTRQTAFDFNELQDRAYRYVSSTDSSGWRAGGGEQGAPYGEGIGDMGNTPPMSSMAKTHHAASSSFSMDPSATSAQGGVDADNQSLASCHVHPQKHKVAAPDTVHIPIVEIEADSASTVDSIVSALARGEIFIPHMSVMPEALGVNGVSPPDLVVRFGCERNDDVPPDEWPNWCLEFMHNQLYDYFQGVGARWSKRPFQINLARKVRWKTVKHMNKYFAQCENVINAWREKGPQLLDPQISYIEGGATPAEVARPHGVYLLRNGRATNYFAPNMEPPYNTKMSRSLLRNVINQSWDKKRRDWKSEPDLGLTTANKLINTVLAWHNDPVLCNDGKMTPQQHNEQHHDQPYNHYQEHNHQQAHIHHNQHHEPHQHHNHQQQHYHDQQQQQDVYPRNSSSSSVGVGDFEDQEKQHLQQQQQQQLEQLHRQQHHHHQQQPHRHEQQEHEQEREQEQEQEEQQQQLQQQRGPSGMRSGEATSLDSSTRANHLVPTENHHYTEGNSVSSSSSSAAPAPERELSLSEKLTRELHMTQSSSTPAEFHESPGMCSSSSSSDLRKNNASHHFDAEKAANSGHRLEMESRRSSIGQVRTHALSVPKSHPHEQNEYQKQQQQQRHQHEQQQQHEHQHQQQHQYHRHRRRSYAGENKEGIPSHQQSDHEEYLAGGKGRIVTTALLDNNDQSGEPIQDLSVSEAGTSSVGMETSTSTTSLTLSATAPANADDSFMTQQISNRNKDKKKKRGSKMNPNKVATNMNSNTANNETREQFRERLGALIEQTESIESGGANDRKMKKENVRFAENKENQKRFELACGSRSVSQNNSKKSSSSSATSGSSSSSLKLVVNTSNTDPKNHIIHNATPDSPTSLVYSIDSSYLAGYDVMMQNGDECTTYSNAHSLGLPSVSESEAHQYPHDMQQLRSRRRLKGEEEEEGIHHNQHDSQRRRRGDGVDESDGPIAILPSTSSLEPLPTDEELFAIGWAKALDQKSGCYYYFTLDRSQTVWENPLATAAAAAGRQDSPMMQ